jgi:hypothetical protein
VIQKNTTYTSEGVEQNNTTQIHVEHTKTISETTESIETSSSEKSVRRGLEKSNNDFETNTTSSTSSFDASEENLVYLPQLF